MEPNQLMRRINLQGKVFVPPSEGWYNLQTGRTRKAVVDGYVTEGRVQGTPAQVEAYRNLNRRIPGLFGLPVDFGWVRTPPPPAFPTEGSAWTTCRDPEFLTDAQVSRLETFNLSGLTGKVKVVSVIDGDTVDGIVWVPNSFLLGLTRKDEAVSCRATGDVRGDGWFLRLRWRLAGIDTPETSTEEGRRVKVLVTRVVEAYRGILWVVCGEYDKFGRVLGTFYVDSSYAVSLNNYFLLRGWGRPYWGGSKDS